MGQCVIIIDLFSMEHMWARIDEEHNLKEKNVYFSNMKKMIKHYPMTDRLIVIREYIHYMYNINVHWRFSCLFICLTQFYWINSNTILNLNLIAWIIHRKWNSGLSCCNANGHASFCQQLASVVCYIYMFRYR